LTSNPGRKLKCGADDRPADTSSVMQALDQYALGRPAGWGQLVAAMAADIEEPAQTAVANHA
jgi:hypothetical protein